ncbi:subtilisin-like protease SBT1.7 [Silene latifolia]|uniref:subtilisin-like protease SBT1.7 n=1 Tax=Silene latifolia TaxID=37657 RepID=UPI003D76EAFA
MKFHRVLIILLFPYLICSYEEELDDQGRRTTYIVHMDKSRMPASYGDHHEWFYSSLKSASNSAQMMYIYSSAIHGFSTRLTDEEANSLAGQPGILSLNPETRYELHTTRTPEFLGLGTTSERLLPTSASQSDVIIGLLDTGVWPELKSFDDTGLGPVPSAWKGECEAGTNFSSSNCNRKLIGARYFYKGYEATLGPIDESRESKSPRDDDGHGTHTSSTAGGTAISGASLFGYALGTARGMAEHARIAVYKACWMGGCFGTDILAAMEKAIDDGVDILSMSIGGSITDYSRDIVAVGAFTAMTKGVFVSCSAGNAGPDSGTLSNVAPWITTVGAGTLDRDFPAYVILGDGKNFTGSSLYSGKRLPSNLMLLVYAGNNASSGMTEGNLCMGGSLEPKHVSGKIVVCDRGGNSRVEKGVVVKEAGGVGMILANTAAYGEELVADAHLIPAASIGQKAGDWIKKYISSNSNPTATIGFSGTELGVGPSPVVAAFSSRGPNPITPEILKPDLIAPGVNILAGWTDKVGPTALETDTRHVSFNIISGTSMSCPHVSGLAALVKAAHPEWGPAAIKSALMTTAYTAYKNSKMILDVATGLPATPFGYGAGHVDPIAALDPGLVYDATVIDYLDFLCALNYSSELIKHTTNQEYNCSSKKTCRIEDLNYPSFSVALETSTERRASNEATTVKYIRTLTNVGTPAIYKASVSSNSKAVKITVEPNSLSFNAVQEKKSFTVTISAISMPSGTTSFDHLTWSDGKHTVTSPIAYTWT